MISFENLIDVLNSYSPFLGAVSSVIMAVFTALLWRINRRQGKIYSDLNDPSLQVFCAEPEWRKAPSPTYYKESYETEPERPYLACEVILSNPGSVPIVLTGASEKLQRHGKTEVIEVKGEPVIPSYRPERVYILRLPWVIGIGQFAIWSRGFKLSKDEDVDLDFEFTYHVRETKKLARRKIEYRK